MDSYYTVVSLLRKSKEHKLQTYTLENHATRVKIRQLTISYESYVNYKKNKVMRTLNKMFGNMEG